MQVQVQIIKVTVIKSSCCCHSWTRKCYKAFGFALNCHHIKCHNVNFLSRQLIKCPFKNNLVLWCSQNNTFELWTDHPVCKKRTNCKRNFTKKIMPESKSLGKRCFRLCATWWGVTTHQASWADGLCKYCKGLPHPSAYASLMSRYTPSCGT